MVYKIPRFKSAIRALTMLKDELERAIDDQYDHLTKEQVEKLNYRICEIRDAIGVLENYEED